MPSLPLRPAQVPAAAGRAAYARAHAFFAEQVSCVEVCWRGARQLVHFPPPTAASHLPPEYEEGLLRALLAHGTPHARTRELLLQQDVAHALMSHRRWLATRALPALVALARPPLRLAFALNALLINALLLGELRLDGSASHG